MMAESLTYSNTPSIHPVRENTEVEKSVKSDFILIKKAGNNYLLVETCDCLISRVDIKAKNQKDLFTAVPYALEDNLAQSVEELHFVTGDVQENGERPVLITSRKKMDEWCNHIQADIEYILPDVLTLPLNDNSWTVVIDNERALVRSDLYDGFECQVSQLDLQLSLYGKDKISPKNIDLCLHESKSIPFLSEDIRDRVKLHRYTDTFVDWMQKKAIPVNELNLLSGLYSIKDNKPSGITYWLPAIISIILTVVVHYGFVWKDVSQLENKIAELNQNSRDLFKESFPETKRIVNPRVQAEQKIKAMSANIDKPGNSFFSIFMQSMANIRNFPNINIIGFDWKNNYLLLQLYASTVTEIELLEKSLVKDNYKVDVINVVNKDGRFRAQLKIRESASS